MSNVNLSVCDGKDNDFNTDMYRILTAYQGGQVDGHFLKIQDNVVIATASNSDKNINFTIRSVGGDVDDNDKYDIWIITDSSSGKTLAVKPDDEGSYSFTVKTINDELASIQSLSEAKARISECLFKKVHKKGSSTFFLTSYKTNADGKSVLLAVDDDGILRTDHPPAVSESDLDNDNDKRHLFRILPSTSR